MQYVVTAYRFANKEQHSYVVGIYDTYDLGKDAGLAETQHRSGKYICEIIGCEINQSAKKPLYKEWLKHT